jgi:hypothetical protein
LPDFEAPRYDRPRAAISAAIPIATAAVLATSYQRSDSVAELTPVEGGESSLADTVKFTTLSASSATGGVEQHVTTAGQSEAGANADKTNSDNKELTTAEPATAHKLLSTVKARASSASVISRNRTTELKLGSHKTNSTNTTANAADSSASASVSGNGSVGGVIVRKGTVSGERVTSASVKNSGTGNSSSSADKHQPLQHQTSNSSTKSGQGQVTTGSRVSRSLSRPATSSVVAERRSQSQVPVESRDNKMAAVATAASAAGPAPTIQTAAAVKGLEIPAAVAAISASPSASSITSATAASQPRQQQQQQQQKKPAAAAYHCWRHYHGQETVGHEHAQ